MVDIKYTLTSGRLLVELPRKMKFGFDFLYSAGGGRIGGYKKPEGERHCSMLSLAGWVSRKAWI